MACTKLFLRPQILLGRIGLMLVKMEKLTGPDSEKYLKVLSEKLTTVICFSKIYNLTINITVAWCLDEVRKAHTKRTSIIEWAKIVERFLISSHCSTNGIVPMVQSQQSSLGRARSQRLTDAK